MRAGDGQATFTAECSHTFHFSCISASAAHGDLVCPLCNAPWPTPAPFVRPTPTPVPQPPPLPPQWRNHHVRPVVMPQRVPAPPPRQPDDDVDPVVVSWHHNRFPRRLVPAPPPLPPQWRDHHVLPVVMPQRRNHHVDPVVVVAVPQSVTAPRQQRRNHHVGPVVVIFDDDEQVEPVSGVLDGRPSVGASAATNGAVVVKTHTEWSAVARDSSSDSFAVLVHLKAPGMVDTDAAPRAPLDLVTVLDVSGSMSGQKLALLKQAMRFVIDNLGPDDRLSVVSFSSEARRVTRLARMTDAGKASCVRAVESLSASGGTNIAEGLRTAAKVLDERRHRNAVSSVVLLSDGQDTYTMVTRRDGGANYEALVPPSFMRTEGEWSAPIHTFGFGNDHDAAGDHGVKTGRGLGMRQVGSMVARGLYREKNRSRYKFWC